MQIDDRYKFVGKEIYGFYGLIDKKNRYGDNIDQGIYKFIASVINRHQDKFVNEYKEKKIDLYTNW